MSKFDKSRRFQMERLEVRQMMARDTGAGLDGIPLDEPPGTEYEPPISEIEPPAYVGPIRNFRPNSPMTWAPLPHFEPNVPESPTGDVTAKLIGGNLYLSETPGFEGADNGILITQLPNGVIRITGISAHGGPTSLINGAAYQDFALGIYGGLGHLFVSFGDGNDVVKFDSIDVVNLQDVVIDVGTPGADGSSDNDVVSITNLHARGILMVSAGAGADTVRVNGVNHVEGRVHIWTYNYNAPDDAANDLVQFSGLARFDQFLDVKLGGGDDDFFVNVGANGQNAQLLVNGSIDVDAGAGNDDIYLSHVVSGVAGNGAGLNILAGAGQDTIVGDNGWFGSMSIKTWDSLAEPDKDTVHLQSIFVAGDMVVDLGGGDDEFIAGNAEDLAPNHGVWAASILVNTGAGADRVYIEGTTVSSQYGGTGDLSIYTGAGADVVNLDFRPLPSPYDTSVIPEVWGSLVIKTFDQYSETDGDEVRIRSANVYKGLSVGLGAGDDFFEVLGGNYGWVAIDANDGADVGFFEGFIYQQGRIDMGAGDDHLTLGNVRKPYILMLSGGDGEDTLQKTQEVLADQLFEYRWEFIDGVGNGQEENTNPDWGGGVIGAP